MSFLVVHADEGIEAEQFFAERACHGELGEVDHDLAAERIARDHPAAHMLVPDDGALRTDLAQDRIGISCNLARKEIDLHGSNSGNLGALARSEEHTSELQSLMRIPYAVFCLKKKQQQTTTPNHSSDHTQS